MSEPTECEDLRTFRDQQEMLRHNRELVELESRTSMNVNALMEQPEGVILTSTT